MLKLESEVEEFAQMTIDKVLRSAGKEPFDVKEAFNCFTADIISQYAFGEPMGFIEQEGWEPNFATWVKSFFRSAYMVRRNALGRKLAQVLPLMADYLGEGVKMVMHQMNVVIPQYIRAALKDPEYGRVFANVMESKSLPESEKLMFWLSGEGFNFLLAGTETTAVSKQQIPSHRDSTAHPKANYHHNRLLSLSPPIGYLPSLTSTFAS
jgi:cytochrome P450